MDRTAALAAIEQRLKTAGLGFESIKVFGALRLNVHVTCVSRTTADKWARLLGQAFRGARVSLVETTWHAAENKGTNLRPTLRKGYLVGAIGA